MTTKKKKKQVRIFETRPGFTQSVYPFHSSTNTAINGLLFHFSSSINSHSILFTNLIFVAKLEKMDSVVPVAIASIILGAVIAVLFFHTYFRKRTSEVQSMAKAEPQNPIRNPKSNQTFPKKNHPKSHASDKVKICEPEFRDLDVLSVDFVRRFSISIYFLTFPVECRFRTSGITL